MFSEEGYAHHDKLAKLLATPDAVNEFSQFLMGDDPTFKEFYKECAAAMYHIYGIVIFLILLIILETNPQVQPLWMEN
jgi:hypothetical protein